MFPRMWFHSFYFSLGCVGASRVCSCGSKLFSSTPRQQLPSPRGRLEAKNLQRILWPRLMIQTYGGGGEEGVGRIRVG